MVTLQLSDREAEEVLCALRAWQGAVETGEATWDMSRDEGAELNVDEVDQICERLLDGMASR